MWRQIILVGHPDQIVPEELMNKCLVYLKSKYDTKIFSKEKHEKYHLDLGEVFSTKTPFKKVALVGNRYVTYFIHQAQALYIHILSNSAKVFVEDILCYRIGFWPQRIIYLYPEDIELILKILKEDIDDLHNKAFCK